MPPTRSSASVTVLSTSVAVAASSPLRARYLTRGNANMQSSVDGDDSYVDNYVPQLPKQREMCTPEQKDALEQLYELTQGYPSTAQRHELAARIGKSPESTYVWFQNKRNSGKEKKKRASANKKTTIISTFGSAIITSSSASSSSGSSRAPSSTGLPSPARSTLSVSSSSVDFDWAEHEAIAIEVLTNALRTMPKPRDQHTPPPAPADATINSNANTNSYNVQPTSKCPLIQTTESATVSYERMSPPRTNISSEPHNLRTNDRVMCYSEVCALRGLAQIRTQTRTIQS